MLANLSGTTTLNAIILFQFRGPGIKSIGLTGVMPNSWY